MSGPPPCPVQSPPGNPLMRQDRARGDGENSLTCGKHCV
ncbi:unnamed protein product [Gulo gulo]|uniref:Uncharacterized protein n=1 Tax=Gulo gulo TaxID=48420 RepID=A0A9X9M9P0_GULGU|nr:unnamed protein product [Gulo gulo]